MPPWFSTRKIRLASASQAVYYSRLCAELFVATKRRCFFLADCLSATDFASLCRKIKPPELRDAPITKFRDF